MRFLKQSTAATVNLGPFIDDSDRKTPKTSLTIDYNSIYLSKNGGSFNVKNNLSAAEHSSGGHYLCSLNTTDTNTLGTLRMFANITGALPVWEDFMVVPAVVYDALIAGSDNLNVNVAEISDDSTAADNCEKFFDGTGYAGTNNTIPTVTSITNTVSANVTQISGAAVNAGTAQIGANVVNWKGSAAPANTGDAYARLGAPAGVSVSADVAAIKTDSGAIKAKTDGLNFTGTDVKATLDGEPVALSADQAVNVTKIAGAAVSTSTAQVGVNVVSQANIDFGATQKASIATAVSGLVIENSKTFLQVVRSMFAILCGKTSGGGTDTLKFRDNADLKDRVTVTVDANKNRTGITLDPS